MVSFEENHHLHDIYFYSIAIFTWNIELFAFKCEMQILVYFYTEELLYIIICF